MNFIFSNVSLVSFGIEGLDIELLEGMFLLRAMPFGSAKVVEKVLLHNWPLRPEWAYVYDDVEEEYEDGPVSYSSMDGKPYYRDFPNALWMNSTDSGFCNGILLTTDKDGGFVVQIGMNRHNCRFESYLDTQEERQWAVLPDGTASSQCWERYGDTQHERARSIFLRGIGQDIGEYPEPSEECPF